MGNLRKVLANAKNKLCNNFGYENRDADFILEKVLGRKFNTLEDIELNEKELTKFQNLIERRLNHEPMDSILGYTEFVGLTIPFSVDTLTPRQETEIMTDNIIRENCHRKGLKILDLCTGSGCIGLALSKHLLDADVTLSDTSDKALIIAKDNAEKNKINVKIIKSDLFENIKDKYDIIVSNPPYIKSEDISTLEKEVVDFDPILALDGGKDGLDIYRAMADNMAKYLCENGLIYVEFGVGQTNDILKLFDRNFYDLEIIKDYSGIDRYLKAKRK